MMGQKMSKSIQSSENQRVERVKSVEQKQILSSSARKDWFLLVALSVAKNIILGGIRPRLYLYFYLYLIVSIVKYDPGRNQ